MDEKQDTGAADAPAGGPPVPETPAPLRWEDEAAPVSTELEDAIFRKQRIAKRIVIAGWILATAVILAGLIVGGALHEHMAKVHDFVEGCAGCAGGHGDHDGAASTVCEYRHCGAPATVHRELVVQGETAYLVGRDVIQTQTMDVALCRIHARAAEKGRWLDQANLSSRLLKAGVIALVGGILFAGLILGVMRVIFGRQFVEDLSE